MMIFQETETVELKKSTSELKEAVISIVAMLNKHQRGEVSFGVKNDGTVVGQQVSDKTIRDVPKAIADHIEPKIYPIVEQVDVDGKQCIKVQVEGSEYPYYAYGRAYNKSSHLPPYYEKIDIELSSKNHSKSWQNIFTF